MWNCRVCVEMFFLRLLCAFLPSLTTLEWIDQQFAKTKMEDISSPSNLNGIIGLTSYYCVILKIMILHDAIITIKNKVFPFSLKEQNLVYLKKKKKTWVFLNPVTLWMKFLAMPIKALGFYCLIIYIPYLKHFVFFLKRNTSFLKLNTQLINN